VQNIELTSERYSLDVRKDAELMPPSTVPESAARFDDETVQEGVIAGRPRSLNTGQSTLSRQESLVAAALLLVVGSVCLVL
jgi:hypothetical protein